MQTIAASKSALTFSHFSKYRQSIHKFVTWIRYLMRIADGLATNGYAVEINFKANTRLMQFSTRADFKPTRILKGRYRQQAISSNSGNHPGDYIMARPKQFSEAIRVYLQSSGRTDSISEPFAVLSLKDFEVHMTVYPVGSFYKRHLDQFKKDDHRKLSVIPLSEQSMGRGARWPATHVFVRSNKDFLPVAGRLVISEAMKLSTKCYRQHVND